MIKTIILDLNKVLVAYKRIDEDYQKTFGISQDKFWEPREMFFNDYITAKINLDEFLLKIMKINQIDENKLSDAKKLHEKNLSLAPEMKDLLDSLEKKHSLILATGDGKESLDIKLNKFGLKQYFKKIYATCHMKKTKKDIDFYREILSKSNLNPGETLFIDDQESYLELAKKLGMHTILFESPSKLKQDIRKRFNIIV